MSLIVSEVYDALIEAGTSEEKAKAAAGAIPLAERLVTKEDLDELKASFKEGLDELKASFDERFGKIDERFGKIDERFGKIDEHFGKIDERFGKIDERFAKIDERFAKIERDLGLLKFGYGPAILALLVKIAFF